MLTSHAPIGQASQARRLVLNGIVDTIPCVRRHLRAAEKSNLGLVASLMTDKLAA